MKAVVQVKGGCVVSVITDNQASNLDVIVVDYDTSDEYNDPAKLVFADGEIAADLIVSGVEVYSK